MQEKLRLEFPNEFKERIAALEEEKNKYIDIFITYGNKHELVKIPNKSNSNPEVKNTHRWTAFVEVENMDKIIKNVNMRLHETFKNPIFDLKP